MEKEKSLIAKSDKRGIRKIVNNVVEFIKSKVDKSYILSESSPEFLKQNRLRQDKNNNKKPLPL